MPMLIVKRKETESVLIGGDVRVTVVDVTPTTIKLAIEAPESIRIVRGELATAGCSTPAPFVPKRGNRGR